MWILVLFSPYTPTLSSVRILSAHWHVSVHVVVDYGHCIFASLYSFTIKHSYRQPRHYLINVYDGIRPIHSALPSLVDKQKKLIRQMFLSS
jgi:hypothetical protein